MTFMIETQPLPLMLDSDGVIRIGGTRVTLDTVIAAFLDGATAEEIAQQYPVLRLPDIYSVLGYYLQQRPRVDSYLQRREQYAAKVQQQNTTKFAAAGIRARLLARQASLSTASC